MLPFARQRGISDAFVADLSDKMSPPVSIDKAKKFKAEARLSRFTFE
jgi:hypothetical protein